MNRENEKAMFAGKNKSGLTKEQLGLTEKEIIQRKKQQGGTINYENDPKFDYNKILNEIYPLSKTQVSFYKNPRGYKKGVILGSWHKLIQTNGTGWVLRMTGKTEDEIWNKMKPEIIKRIYENFDNLITWTDYVGNEMSLGKYFVSKEKINETKQLQIVVKNQSLDTIKKIDI